MLKTTGYILQNIDILIEKGCELIQDILLIDDKKNDMSKIPTKQEKTI